MSLDGLFAGANNRVVSLSDRAIISKLHNVIDTEDITYIVGSAVSLFPPASVVNGQRVTGAIAEALARGLPNEDLIREVIGRAAFEVILQFNSCDAAIRKWLLRLFASDGPKSPNSIHKALARSLAKRPANLVTTNYDRFIERALTDEGVSFHTIVTADDANVPTSSIRYFKIHGCTSDSSSLIFKLEQERPLQGWKARTFRSLIEGKTVILIGYSGKDFEICPALYENNAKAILWNALPGDLQDGNFPSENAGHLFANIPSMLFLSGDMHDIFEEPSQKPANVNEELLNELLVEMGPAELSKWRASVLNVIGAPRQMKKVLSNYRPHFDAKSRYEHLTSIAYRQGKYRTAVYYGMRLAGARSEGEGPYGLALRAGLDAAFKLRNRGNHRLARVAFGVACIGWRGSRFALRREYALNMAWFEILDRFRFARHLRRLTKRIEQMEFISLHQGFWGSFYLARDAFEALRPSARPKSRNRPPPMPAQHGFKHIGNVPGQIHTFETGGLRPGASWAQVNDEIQLACDTDLHPERWKCALTALENGGWSLTQDLFLMRHVAAGLWKCEYTIPYATRIAWRTARVFMRRHGSDRWT